MSSGPVARRGFGGARARRNKTGEPLTVGCGGYYTILYYTLYSTIPYYTNSTLLYNTPERDRLSQLRVRRVTVGRGGTTAALRGGWGLEQP